MGYTPTGNKDFGRTDYWAPESNLDTDPNNPGVTYTLSDGSTLNVKPNDWLDVDPMGLPPTSDWGSSFQVIEPHEDAVIVRGYNPELDLYEPIAVSPQYILNNYRRVPKNVETS
jgi:hypothetical protein